jgi:glucose/arabinose dehydrogenase
MARLPRAFATLVALFVILPTSAAAEVAPPSPAAEQPTAALRAGQVDLRFVEGGLSQPIAVTNAGDGTNRLFVAQRGGAVRVIANEALVGGVFLTVTGLAGGFSSDGERGLLGLAFHPSFETNRKVYVYYTEGDGDLVVAEFTANGAGTSATFTERILDIEHSSFNNHNGGQISFGPDGNLYVFTGDGGSGGDPSDNGQNSSSLLGKVLRINVDGAGYTIPAGNPYGNPVWDIGLRNPFRASFDRATGDMWIGDVGQGTREEVSRHPAGTGGGLNFGWDVWEGTFCHEGPCTQPGFTFPVVEYSQVAPRAVTGGFVYRGPTQMDLVGHYVFTDYYSGNLWTIPPGGSSMVFHRSIGRGFAGFGEGENGELYAVNLETGTLYQVVAPPFNDIAGSIFYFDILWAHGTGVTVGCTATAFCPNNAVTREQMASFLVRALGLPATGTDFFTDDWNSVHQSDINRVAAAGIASGCGGGRFCPSLELSREQMASFLVRAFRLPHTGSDFFSDDAGSIHQSDINRLAASGITTGCGGTRYCPLETVTRGQMTAFLHRAKGG